MCACCQDADASEIKVQVCVYAFDLLYLNGESLVSEPFRRRRELLQSCFRECEGEFMFTKSLVTADTERVQEFLEESIKGLVFHSSGPYSLAMIYTRVDCICQNVR